MIQITIYKPTGEISRNVTCPESMVDVQIKENEQYIIGIFESTMYYIENALPVLKATPPNNFYIFDYNQKTWVADTKKALFEIKIKRDKLLFESDWTQMPDVVLSNKAEWATYRQELRDITTQSNPFNIIWPSKPE
jgi:hypothetical protein